MKGDHFTVIGYTRSMLRLQVHRRYLSLPSSIVHLMFGTHGKRITDTAPSVTISTSV